MQSTKNPPYSTLQIDDEVDEGDNNTIELKVFDKFTKGYSYDDKKDENLLSQPTPSWWQSIKKGAGILKTPAKVAAAAAASAPTAVFALAAWSKWPLSKIAANWPGWWGSMDAIGQGISIVNAVCCEYVNYLVNRVFFDQFWDKMKASFENFAKSPKDSIISIVSIILGAAGGIAAGALAFEGMQFFLPAAIAFACFNFSVFFISRYLGVNKTLNRLLNRETINTQRAVIDKLKHMKAEYKKDLEADLQRIVKDRLIDKDETELSEKDFEAIFEKLANVITSLNPEHFDEKTYAEQAAEIAGTLFDVTFSTYIAIISLITFTRKKRAGIEALFRFLTGSNPLEGVSNLEKIPAGILGGIASSMLYFISAMDFRTLFVDACKFSYNHPSEIPSFLFDVGTNFFGASGMFGVSGGIPGDSEFDIPMNPLAYWLFAAGGWFGAFSVNGGAMLKKRIETPDLQKPTVTQFESYFGNPSINCISKETATRINEQTDGELLRNYSMFAPKRPEKAPAYTPVNDEEHVDFLDNTLDTSDASDTSKSAVYVRTRMNESESLPSRRYK